MKEKNLDKSQTLRLRGKYGRYLEKFFRIDSLKKGWIFSIAILIFAFTIGIGYFFFGVIHDSRQQAIDGFNRLSEVSAENVSQRLGSSQEAAQMAAYSNSTQRYLLAEQPSVVINSTAAVNDMLNMISTYGNGFTDIFLFSDSGRKVSINNRLTDLVHHAFSVSGQESVHFTQSFYSPSVYYKGEKYVLYFFPVYGIVDGYRYRYNPIYGAVIYKVSDLLESLVCENYEGGVSVILDGEKVVGSTRVLTPSEISMLRTEEPGSRILRIGGEQFLVSVSEQAETGWKLIYFAPVRSLNITYGGTGSGLLIIVFAAVLLSAVLVVGFLSLVRKDIDRMTADVRTVGISGGRVSMPNLLEIRPIADAFNLALDDRQASAKREQELVAAQYEARLAQNNAEMIAYRSQINPHFLFNTLESVRSLAHRYGAGPVEQLVGGMSYMCRYSLYSKMIVKLEDELGHLGAYFTVMDARFPGRYTIMEAIDPDVLLYPALSMMLQPIAENALLHAFNGRRSGIVMVQAFKKEETLHVRIADNGVGMDEDVLERVRWRIHHADGETAHIDGVSDHGPEYKISIGLPNIYRRLRLAFGEKADLSVRSKKGYYTAVEITLPLKPVS